MWTYLRLHPPLLLPHRHLPIIKQPLQIILNTARFLPQLLPQNIHLMLQLIPFRAHPLHLPRSQIPYLGLEFRTRGAEEVRFVLDVALGDQPLPREHHVLDQETPHRFHQGDGLFFCVGAFGELAHQAIGVEVVHVRRRFEVRRFVRFVAGAGHVEDAVERLRGVLSGRLLGRGSGRCVGFLCGLRGGGGGFGEDMCVRFVLLFLDILRRVVRDLGRDRVAQLAQLRAQVRRGLMSFPVPLDGSFHAAE